MSSICNVVTVMLDWRDNGGILATATYGRGVYAAHFTSPLPVELNSFSGIFQNSKVKLLWKTKPGINNYCFEILRAVYPAVGVAQNGGHPEPDLLSEEFWEKIGFIEGHGNSNSPKSYEFVYKTEMVESSITD